MRASECARGLAVWDGGAKPPSQAGEPDWIKSQRCARSRRGNRRGGRRRRKSRGRGELFASLPCLWLDRTILRARRIQRRRVDGVDPFPGRVRAAQMARRRRLASMLARITVLHRQGAGCYGHNSADDVAFDAAFVALRVPNRTVRVQWTREDEFSAAPDGRGHGGRPARCARRQCAPGRLDDRDLEPGARAASGHERTRKFPRRAGAARRTTAARRDQRRRRRSGRRRDPQRAGALRPAAAQARASSAPAGSDAGPRRCAASAPLRTCSQSSRSWTSSPRSPGEDPVAYRLSLMSDPRARRVIETAAEMGGWLDTTRARGPRTRLRLCPLQEPRRLRGGGGRGRGRRAGPCSPAYGPPSTPAS